MSCQDPYPYACECPDKRCRRKVVLRHGEYLRRAALGPVLALDCPTRLQALNGNAATLRDWATA
jgi:hypothetical protein